MGFAGQLSLGHALYVGLGAYTTAALYVHFGIGPWVGMPVAILISVASGVVIGFLAFRFGVAGVYFAILTIAFAEFARIGFDHFAWVQGSSGLFLPVANHASNDLINLRGKPAMFYYVILALTVVAFVFCHMLLRSRVGYFWQAIREDEVAARVARHQHVPLQDDRDRHLVRHDRAGRRVLCVLLQQPLPRADVLHPALDRDHPRADHRRHRHAVRSGHRRVPHHRACLRSCEELLSASGLDMPGAKRVFYGVCLLVVVMVLPHGIWPPLARLLRLGKRKAARRAGGVT